jgi:hypothetical protein
VPPVRSSAPRHRERQRHTGPFAFPLPLHMSPRSDALEPFTQPTNTNDELVKRASMHATRKVKAARCKASYWYIRESWAETGPAGRLASSSSSPYGSSGSGIQMIRCGIKRGRKGKWEYSAGPSFWFGRRHF